MKRLVILIALILISSCANEVQESGESKITEPETIEEVDNMKLTSPDFKEGQPIPREHSCDGSDISPALAIEDVPAGAKSLALIMDDPDAPMGTWVHWVVWNIPVDKKQIQKGEQLSNQGITDFGKPGYGGPCPPSGTHRYFFKLYALDTELELGAETTKKDLEKAMEGRILAEAKLMGTYKRG